MIRDLSRGEPGRRSDGQWPGDNIDGWDAVDEASWESFPASDPPGWIAVRPSIDPVVATAPEPRPLPPRHRARGRGPRVIAAVVLAASAALLSLFALLRRRS